jgi:hypothetical protein
MHWTYVDPSAGDRYRKKICDMLAFKPHAHRIREQDFREQNKSETKT